MVEFLDNKVFVLFKIMKGLYENKWGLKCKKDYCDDKKYLIGFFLMCLYWDCNLLVWCDLRFEYVFDFKLGLNYDD